MKAVMMEKSSTLAIVVLQAFISSLSNWLKPHTMAATATQAPPSVSRTVRLSRLMRW